MAILLNRCDDCGWDENMKIVFVKFGARAGRFALNVSLHTAGYTRFIYSLHCVFTLLYRTENKVSIVLAEPPSD